MLLHQIEMLQALECSALKSGLGKLVLAAWKIPSHPEQISA